MRYSPEHKAQNHERILAVAARSFREQGGDSSGVGTVMKRAGLTKGGFYRHFESKDDLLVEAVARAFEGTGRQLAEIARAAPEGLGLRAIIEYYLSAEHAATPGSGCVIAALGPELARRPASVRKRVEAALDTYRERLLPFIPGDTCKEKSATFGLLFPSMAGVLTMARVTSSARKRERLLMQARNFFIRGFTQTKTGV